MLFEHLEPRTLFTAVPTLFNVHYEPLEEHYDGHSQVIDGVLNIWAPDPVDFGGTWTVDCHNPDAALYGADGVPQLTSIRQGFIADCYLLAASGALALGNPASIQSMIWWDGTGFAVTWHGFFEGMPVAKIIHTAPTFSLNLQANTGEIWWEVIEKTDAYFRTSYLGVSQNSMASLNLGFSSAALLDLGQHLVSQPVTQIMSARDVANLIESTLTIHQAVILNTFYDAPDLVHSHCYIVTGIDSAAGLVTTYNPWGFYDVRPLSLLMVNGSFIFGVY